MSLPAGVHLTLSAPRGGEEILSAQALEFLVLLHKTFNARRLELLENRKKVQAQLDKVRGKTRSGTFRGRRGRVWRGVDDFSLMISG
jgi:malate synthase